MPYVDSLARKMLQPHSVEKAIGPGDLAFQITFLIKGYLQMHGKRYSTMAEIVGVLEATKLEFVRRVVDNYENDKIRDNGDVYEAGEDF